MEIKTLKQVKVSDIGDYLKLLNMYHKDPEKMSFRRIAELITKEFKVNCEESHIEQYYENDSFSEDFELESRKTEHRINF